jgi:drug/metabolite transporter (DMT)-like permease
MAVAARAGPAPEVRGILLVLFAMGCFGSMDGISKVLVHYYPAPLVLWLRHLVAVPIVLLLLGRGAGARRPFSRAPFLQLLRASILAVEMGLVLVAFRQMQLADVQAILAVGPLLITALSLPILGERVGWRRWAAVLVGFLGVLVLLRPGFTAVHPLALMVLLCAAMYAVYNVLTRLVARVDPPETSFLLQILIAAGLLTLVGPFYWVPVSAFHWLLVVGLAALGALGHYCLVRALTLAPVVLVQPFTYTLLLWAVVIGYLVFGDLPDRWTVAGALVVVGAGIYTVWREHRVRQALATLPSDPA